MECHRGRACEGSEEDRINVAGNACAVSYRASGIGAVTVFPVRRDIVDKGVP